MTDKIDPIEAIRKTWTRGGPHMRTTEAADVATLLQEIDRLRGAKHVIDVFHCETMAYAEQLLVALRVRFKDNAFLARPGPAGSIAVCVHSTTINAWPFTLFCEGFQAGKGEP